MRLSAPDRREQPADLEQMGRVAPAGPRGVQVVRHRGASAVDRGADGAHRGGKDAGDHESREPGRQVVHDERGERAGRPGRPSGASPAAQIADPTSRNR